MECVKQFLSVLMDSIKDAGMMLDYAEMDMDHSEHSDWFKKQAKKRIDGIDSIYEYVTEEIGLDEKIKSGDEIAKALKDHLDSQIEELENRYEGMK